MCVCVCACVRACVRASALVCARAGVAYILCQGVGLMEETVSRWLSVCLNFRLNVINSMEYEMMR